MLSLVFFCLLLPDYENPPCQPPPVFSWEGLRKGGSMAKGIVLAEMVQKGMTREQVRSLLGKPSFTACEGGMVFEAYERYNIQVFWSNNRTAGKIDEPSVVD